MLCAVLRRFGWALVIVTIGLTDVYAGDYLNPSSSFDCFIRSDRYPFHKQERAFAKQSENCWKNIYYDKKKLRIHSPTWTKSSCGEENFGVCMQYKERKCDIKRKIKELRVACKAKLEKKKEWERQVREQEQRYQAQLRQQERARRQHEQDTRRQQENARRERDKFINNSVRRAGSSLFNPDALFGGAGSARQLQSGGIKMGESLARGMGVPRPGGAYNLSNAITGIGTRLLQGMQSEAMSQLQSSMDAFNAGDASMYHSSGTHYSRSNPRPTYAQRQRATSLGEQLQDHAERISQQTYHTPLGEHSAVIGAYANTVNSLIQARADGRISEGLSNVGLVAATALTIKQIYDDVKRKKKQKQNNNRQPYSTADLDRARTQNHQVAMQSVRAEQQRRAQIQQQRAREQARKRQLVAARQRQQASGQRKKTNRVTRSTSNVKHIPGTQCSARFNGRAYASDIACPPSPNYEYYQEGICAAFRLGWLDSNMSAKARQLCW